MNDVTIHSGLENIVVAATDISDVQGLAGKLIVKGYSVEELAPIVTFEGMLHLLWKGSLPSAVGEEVIRKQLGQARVRSFGLASNLVRSMHLPNLAMDFLRTATASLPSDSDYPLIVAMPAVAATIWYAEKTGKQPIEPDPDCAHASDILRMLNGGEISKPAEVRAFESYLATVADHGMNASTFTARVVASTGSDIASAVTAAIGSLKGPLHGGAPGPVLEMLDEIRTPANAAAWLEQELNAGKRIMGMGHRVYKVRDPRAAVLERSIELLEASGHRSSRLALARAVEAAAETTLRRKYPTRDLHANVEFYTAVLLDAVGVPKDLFTAVFAMSRVLGWCAHVDEQKRTGRLIRPESVYIGRAV